MIWLEVKLTEQQSVFFFSGESEWSTYYDSDVLPGISEQLEVANIPFKLVRIPFRTGGYFPEVQVPNAYTENLRRIAIDAGTVPGC